MTLTALAKAILLNTISDFCTSRYALPDGRHIGRRRSLSIPYIIDRIIFVLETGIQWSHLEVIGGSWKTIYHYFSSWSKANLFERAYQHLIKVYVKTRGLSKEIIVDTSFIKNVFGRNCIGPSPFDRGRNATKVSAITDKHGIPLCFTFHPGNKNDSRTLYHTLTKCTVELKGTTLHADKIYDSEHCRNVIASFGINNKVSKKKTIVSTEDNKVRIVVEHLFAWLDKYRRILVRFDGLIDRVRSFHYLAAMHITGRRTGVDLT